MHLKWHYCIRANGRYPLLKDGWDFKLTPQLQSSIDTFTEWYGTQHKNRALSWRHQLGTVTLTAHFDSGKYEIGVSLFQAVVLLQFNDDDVLDFKEIRSRTGIGESCQVVTSNSCRSIGARTHPPVPLARPARYARPYQAPSGQGCGADRQVRIQQGLLE